jgi:hypothetical protein
MTEHGRRSIVSPSLHFPVQVRVFNAGYATLARTQHLAATPMLSQAVSLPTRPSPSLRSGLAPSGREPEVGLRFGFTNSERDQPPAHTRK